MKAKKKKKLHLLHFLHPGTTATATAILWGDMPKNRHVLGKNCKYTDILIVSKI